jgi:WD40 repeat protein
MMLRASLLLSLFAFAGPAWGQLPAELKGHTANVNGLAFNPKGTILATAGFDNTVKLWEFPKGKELFTLKGHTKPVYCVAFSPDGNTLASGSDDKTIRLWNVADGKFIREIKGHTGTVSAVAFRKDGKTLASGSGDKSVRLWNVADGKELKNLGSHAAAVYAIAISLDDKYLASAGNDTPPNQATAVGLVKVWDLATQKEFKTLKGATDALTAVAFTPDSASVVAAGFDSYVRVWTLATGAEAKKMGPVKDNQNIFSMALSKDGKTVATGGYGGTLTVWGLTTGKATWTKKIKFGNYCLAFTPDGKALVSGHEIQPRNKDKRTCIITPIGGK